MKKLIAFLCVLTLVLGMLAGCSTQNAPVKETDETPAQENTTDNTPAKKLRPPQKSLSQSLIGMAMALANRNTPMMLRQN